MITSLRTTRVAAALVAAAALAACGGTKSGRSDYVRDGDTGAASPASTPTLNSPAAPDSTAGVSQRTGTPGAAGDTLGAKGKKP
ncbi:MAG TPA: hypothetical protein VFJ74_14755 [Gemmatimonadaceae bacterium]|nr:hypothetical protein [Gemmatimonadaceae bacterium]